MIAVLRGDPDGFIHWLGVQCASWISTSRGSTGRSLANPEGAEGVQSVEVANFLACRSGPAKKESFWQLKPSNHICVVELMVNIFRLVYPNILFHRAIMSWKTLARVALLCFLTVALTGTWIIEQPRSSLLLQHYRLRQLLDTMEASKSIYNLFGGTNGI